MSLFNFNKDKKTLKSTKSIEINKPLRTPRRVGNGKNERKEYMDKRSFFSFSGYNETLGIVLSVAVSFIGTYLFLPTHGIISALPFVIISAFICAFFNVSQLLKTILFFITPLSVSILLGEKIFQSVVLGVLSMIIYLFAHWSVKLFQKGGVKYKGVSALLLVLTFALHIFANSTPWDVLKNNNTLKNYIASNYSNEPVFVSDVKFNSFDRTYSLTLIPKNSADNALVVTVKDGEVLSDEYIEFAEKFNMIIGAGQITYVMRKLNPELSFYVSSDRIKGYPFSGSASLFAKGDYSKYMDFSVYISTYASAKELSEIAEKCYRELILSGFYCRSITFYGGIGTKYIAKINVPFNSLTEDLGEFVKPYFEKGFIYTCLK